MRCFLLIVLLNFSLTAISQDKKPYAELQVQRFSCGGTDSISLTIYKVNGIYSVNFTSDGCNGPKELKIAAMNKDQIETCNKFFKDLKRFKQQDGCTTSYLYTLFQDDKKIVRFDGGCEWYGIEKLFKKLSNNRTL
jgi:hypothetical protein